MRLPELRLVSFFFMIDFFFPITRAGSGMLGIFVWLEAMKERHGTNNEQHYDPRGAMQSIWV